MTAGTIVVGLSGYAFLSLIGHGRFDPATLAALSSTYLLMNILGPGVFVATEQETSRRVSTGLALRLQVGPTLRRLGIVTVILVLLVAALLLLLAPTLTERVLDDDEALLGALFVAVVGSAAVFGIRGLAGGQRRFRVYAASLFVDGGVRLAGCSALAVAGSSNAVAFAFALCAGPLAAALACIGPARLRNDPDGGDIGREPAVAAPWQAVAGGVGSLVCASTLTMCLANLAPVILIGTVTDNAAKAAAFAIAVVLTRIPLLLISPLQALLLPGMSAAVAAGDRAGFRRRLHAGLTVVIALGLVFALGIGFAGTWAMGELFGVSAVDVDLLVLELLTGSAIIFMTIQFCQPALIALRRHPGLLAGWIAGAIVFGLCFILPAEPLTRAVTAQLVAPLTVLAVHGTLIVLGMRTIATNSDPAHTGGGPSSTAS